MNEMGMWMYLAVTMTNVEGPPGSGRKSRFQRSAERAAARAAAAGYQSTPVRQRRNTQEICTG